MNNKLCDVRDINRMVPTWGGIIQNWQKIFSQRLEMLKSSLMAPTAGLTSELNFSIQFLQWKPEKEKKMAPLCCSWRICIWTHGSDILWTSPVIQEYTGRNMRSWRCKHILQKKYLPAVNTILDEALGKECLKKHELPNHIQHLRI